MAQTTGELQLLIGSVYINWISNRSFKNSKRIQKFHPFGKELKLKLFMYKTFQIYPNFQSLKF